MRAVSGFLYDAFNDADHEIGDKKPNTVVTVEENSSLKETNTAGSYKKLPVRYFQRAADDQVETVIPNVQTVDIDESIDTDAYTCTIVLANSKNNAKGASPAPTQLGQPGFYTATHGDSAEAVARWGQSPNEWAGVLEEGTIVRTYQGLGGHSKTLAQARADGNLIRTGTWEVLDATPTAKGKLTLTCRSMAGLLIDQPLVAEPEGIVPLLDSDGCDVYPLRYCKHYDVRGTQTEIIEYGDFVSADRYIVGIEHAPNNLSCRPGEGYWIAGDDGGTYTYGFIHFFGSAAGLPLAQPIVGISRTADAAGYWLAGADGGVLSYGDAAFHGSLPNDSISVTNIIAIERSQAGAGYYLCGSDGAVYAYGDADFHGSGFGVVAGTAAGMAVKAAGSTGYWIVNSLGAVYAFGGATHHGNASSAAAIVAIAGTPSGNGYYIVDADGAVFAFGDAVYRGGANNITLNDPICDMAVKPDNSGYWLVGKDGGVFTYGTGVTFYGSLPGPWVNLGTVDGNADDLVDVVKDILLWAGFHLYDGGATANVHGSIESTGTFPEECLPDDIFDKRPAIDAINRIKEQVGYICRTDADGGFVFSSPNWWAPGNWLPNGSHTATIPNIDERLQLTDYSTVTSMRPLRSDILISSYNPDASVDGTVTTRQPSAHASNLRGRKKPLIIVNELLTDANQQQIMAELIDMHIGFQRRTGQVRCIGNVLIEVDDQIRIFERHTAETYVHYVRGVWRHHNLDTGDFYTELTTHWLGDSDAWAIAIPSAYVRPSTVAAAASVPAPTVQGDRVALVNVVSVNADVPDSTLSASSTLTPATFTVVAVVPAVTEPSLTATPDTVEASTTVPTPTLTSDATATPSTVAVTATTPTVDVVANSTATPTTVAAIAAAPAPTVDSGGFDPLSIEWFTAFWASDPDWTNPGDGNPVGTWRDAGTKAQDATAASTERPTFRASHASFNNQPIVEFDGVDDDLSTGSWGTSLSQPNEVFVVGRYRTTASSGSIADGTLSSSTRHNLTVNSIGPKWQLRAGTLLNGGTADTAIHLFDAVFNGGSSSLDIDGSNILSGDAGSNALNGVRLGDTYNDGLASEVDIAFYGVFDGTLSAQQRADLLAWSQDTYGTP